MALRSETAPLSPAARGAHVSEARTQSHGKMGGTKPTHSVYAVRELVWGVPTSNCLRVVGHGGYQVSSVAGTCEFTLGVSHKSSLHSASRASGPFSMTSAPPQRVKSAREVKCASWRAPQQAARGAFLSSLRRCTMLAPALRATPQFLPSF
jgi:hypothetical protein